MIPIIGEKEDECSNVWMNVSVIPQTDKRWSCLSDLINGGLKTATILPAGLKFLQFSSESQNNISASPFLCFYTPCQAWVSVLSSFDAVYTVHKCSLCISLWVSVCSFNGSGQAESYLLFHKGFDFPPSGEKRHIRCHYRELKLSVSQERRRKWCVHPSARLSVCPPVRPSVSLVILTLP